MHPTQQATSRTLTTSSWATTSTGAQGPWHSSGSADSSWWQPALPRLCLTGRPAFTGCPTARLLAMVQAFSLHCCVCVLVGVAVHLQGQPQPGDDVPAAGAQAGAPAQCAPHQGQPRGSRHQRSLRLQVRAAVRGVLVACPASHRTVHPGVGNKTLASILLTVLFFPPLLLLLAAFPRCRPFPLTGWSALSGWVMRTASGCGSASTRCSTGCRWPR